MSILSVDNISPIGSGTSVTVNSAATLVVNNVSIAGVTTMSGNLTISNTAPVIKLVDTDSNSDFSIYGSQGVFNIYDETNTASRLTIASDGTITALQGLVCSSDLTIPDSIIHSGDTNTKIRFPAADTITAETSGSERLRIASNGDFGFNDTSPTAHASGNNTVLSIKGKGSSYSGKIDFKDSSGNIDSYINSDNSVLQFYCDPNSQNGNTAMMFYVHGGERVRINASGNVHIGSGDPTIAKLQVSGAGFFGSANTTKTNDGVIIERNSNDGLAHITAGRSGGNYSGFDFYVAGASGVTKRYSIDYQSTFRWFAANGTTERAKITNDGYSKFTSNGTYDGYSNALQAHEFRQSLNKPTLWCSNTSTAQTWEIYRAETARSNNSAFGFISCTSGNLSDDEFRVRGDGNVYADGTFNPNGADYAEYFEWTDGNSSNEDRRGMTVVLDGNKIKVSTSSDSTDNIIGVVSGNASVIGDSSWNKWSDKYLRDDYGAYQRDENGERKLNPSFDDTKTYVSREDRQEWDAIGMVGKLRIRKGQTTGTRWIKMRDISDTVEEWLVR